MTADVLSPRARWICIGLILLLIIAARVRLAGVPFERDEGEYAYMGQLLLHGIPPYSLAYNMKLPGTYMMYALMMSVFGQTMQGIHLAFMVMNCATVVVLYLFAKKLINDVAAVAAAAVYGILTLSPSVDGFAAHATHFVVLPAVGGALLLLHALEREKPSWYFLSGAAFGLAFIMKQPGIFFLFFGAVYLLYHGLSAAGGFFRKTIRDLALFSFGGVAPLAAVAGWLYAAGVFDRFWFWTVQYAAKYGTQVPLSEAFSVFRINAAGVVDGLYLVWILAGLGFLILLFHRDLKERRLFIVLFAFFSFLSVCPGFYFREHYFITLLPAVSLSAGILVNYPASGNVTRRYAWSRYAGPGLLIAALLLGVVQQKDYFFRDTPDEVSRKVYGTNPFPESVEIAKFVEQRSTPNDRIAVFGSEPQIYFYSKRLSATGYIYTYSLFEKHEYRDTMQQEMTREIETANPKFIIFVNVFTSWLVQPKSDMYLFRWLGAYLDRGYAVVGVADILPTGGTVYKWYDEAVRYTPASYSYVLVFERRE